VIAGTLMPSPGPGRIDVRSWLGLVLRAADEANAGAPAGATELDARDVASAAGGDGDAFERIVRRHQQEIARRLRRFARDAAGLEELVHETFVQAYLGLARYRGEAPLIHWLHRIALRTAYRRWKAERRRPGHRPLDASVAAPQTAPADEWDLEGVMQQLSARDRLVLTLLYLEDRTVAQAADLLGWTRTMVKVQAFRARGRLRELMGRRDG
jgi:RNA polymerase sigma-70 factor, ECF subfamily